LTSSIVAEKHSRRIGSCHRGRVAYSRRAPGNTATIRTACLLSTALSSLCLRCCNSGGKWVLDARLFGVFACDFCNRIIL